MHYFNEFNHAAAAWLRELIREGHLPRGEVDERDIREVRPAELRGFTGVHLFAGIGGWAYALRLAGWPDGRPVWTGSCPCQPYSSAGKGLGDADPRDLWPELARLVRECRPECVFGEQVVGAVKHGWLDRVCADLEADGYAVGAVVLGAHSVGSPHIRQRLYWVADAQGERRGQGRVRKPGRRRADEPERLRVPRPVGDAASGGAVPTEQRGQLSGPLSSVATGVLGDTAGERREGAADGIPDAHHAGDGSQRHPAVAGCNGRVGVAHGAGSQPGRQAPTPDGHGRAAFADGGVGFWDAYDLMPCRDGKARRVEPGTFPLAHGVPGRVGLLRGYGNAIVPQVAAEFVAAFLEVEAGMG